MYTLRRVVKDKNDVQIVSNTFLGKTYAVEPFNSEWSLKHSAEYPQHGLYGFVITGQGDVYPLHCDNNQSHYIVGQDGRTFESLDYLKRQFLDSMTVKEPAKSVPSPE